MKKKYFQFSFIAFMMSFVVTAQIFPVQVNSNVIPPYLPTVSSYATTTNQKYFVNIFTADLSVVNRPATLKLYIEGNGIKAQSTPVINGALPINLNGGETISLSNLDLAPYFQIENLQGITPTQYANNLPQGTYNFCIEIYDAFTNQKISQKSCTFYYFLYNEPPLLNMPTNHSVVFSQDPQNLIFTWTPRHPNATNIEYEFTLIELADANAPSNYAFAVGALFYKTTTSTTMLQLGPMEPQLILGRKYAWRVKAVNQAGFGEDAVFNNNGFSEIYDFVYAGNCLAPTSLSSMSLSATQSNLRWLLNPDHLGYKVEYRKLNTANWFETAHFNGEAKLFALEPSATYEFRVGALCAGEQTTYSDSRQFTQPVKDEVAINCGFTPTVDLSNQTLFTAAMPQDQVFRAGDFPIHVTEVTGTTTYTGKGWTKLPYFSFVKIEVEFTNIKLNTDMSLVDGVVKAVYDPNWSNIINVGGILDVADDVGDLFSPDTDEHSYQVNFNIESATGITVTDTNIVVQGSNGETITFERDLGESVIIRDINGDVFGVGPTAGSAVLLQAGASFVPNSSNTTGVNSSGNVTAFNHTKAKVTFKRSSASKFADDEMPTGVNPKIIAKYKKVGDYNYYYKGAANDGKATRSTEFIDAEIEIFNNALTVDKISFNIKGSAAKAVGTPRTAGNKIMLTLEVPVFETVKELELLAIVSAASASDKRTVVGAAMIVPTKILPIVNVTLVPVNGATIPANVQADLQKIYGGIGVTITVAIAPNYTSTITTLECGTSGFMANYTAEQKTFINTYTALKPAEANQYYVFLMNNITPSRPIRGFMPLHRQTGFVFPNQIAASDPKEVNKGSVTNTIAHEIGHGIFELEHPWEDYQYTKGSQLTAWLMDTEGGLKLPYMHWQKISHPKFGLYVFQKDESGEQILSNFTINSTAVETDFKNQIAFKFANVGGTNDGEFYYKGYKIIFTDKSITYDSNSKNFIVNENNKNRELKILGYKNSDERIFCYADILNNATKNTEGNYNYTDLKLKNIVYSGIYTIEIYKNNLPQGDLLILKEKIKNLDTVRINKIISLLETLPLNDVFEICISTSNCYDILGKVYTASDWDKIIVILQNKKDSLTVSLAKLPVADQLSAIKQLLLSEKNNDKICRLILSEVQSRNQTLHYLNEFKIEYIGNNLGTAVFRIELLENFKINKVENIFYMSCPVGSSIVNTNDIEFKLYLDTLTQQLSFNNLPKGTSASERLSNLIGQSVWAVALALPSIYIAGEYFVGAELYTAYLGYLQTNNALCLKSMALDLFLQLMIDKLVKEYNGEGVPFSYTSLTVSCALAYAGNLSLKEACAVGAITSLGDDLLYNLTSKQPKPIINTITQASILCLVSAGLHHVVKTNYKAAVIESVQWFYLKSLILKPLNNIQKAIISKFMVARGSSITANIVAKIINNSTDDVATNIAKLEQYIAEGKNVVAQGEEILIKDADNKIFDKFVGGKWVTGAGSLSQNLTGALKTSYNKLITSGLNAVEEGNLIKLFNSKKALVAEISNNRLIFKYEGWGKDIITNSEKTTTCIAKFDDLLDAPGSKWIKNDLPEGSFGRGAENKGGINILDVDNVTYLKLSDEAVNNLKKTGNNAPTKNQIDTEVNEIFWNRYNLPFLEQAFARGDDIRLLSEPSTLFSSTGFYQREIEVIKQGWTKVDGTFVQPLKTKYNYKFNDVTKSYEKIK